MACNTHLDFLVLFYHSFILLHLQTSHQATVSVYCLCLLSLSHHHPLWGRRTSWVWSWLTAGWRSASTLAPAPAQSPPPGATTTANGSPSPCHAARTKVSNPIHPLIFTCTSSALYTYLYHICTNHLYCCSCSYCSYHLYLMSYCIYHIYLYLYNHLHILCTLLLCTSG